MADYGYGAVDDSGVDYGTDDDFGTGGGGYGHNLTGIDDPIDTNIDYGYSTVINGVTYTKDKDGKWTYEDSGGNIQPISQAAVDKLTNTANQTSNSTFQAKLKDPSFVKKINDALGTNFSAADLLKIGAAGLGGIAGAMGANTATTKPTGYQGGIPDLVATQPMLTEPPPGRRPGSGGINYGTGVQYKDSKGNIVSDTSTPIADLYRKATQEGTFNQWGNTYGNIPTPAPVNPVITNTPPIRGNPPPPVRGNPPPSNGIATGIDPAHPWSKASSDPKIRAIQNELEQLSHTKGTPAERQTVLDQFLHSTKYTPAQLSAASNGMWGVQDLIDQMQGNSNVFNAQTPWSVYSTKADIKGVQDALQQLSQTPGDDKTRQAALQNFLKTTKYTPAQLAAASNGMWKISDLETQMAGNPVLTDLNKGKTNPEAAPSSQAGSSNAPAGGFVTGGGNTGGEYGAFGSKEAYDKAVAMQTAKTNAENAARDAYQIPPDSPFYAASIGATGDRLNGLKESAYELQQRQENRAKLAAANPGVDGFVVSDPNNEGYNYGASKFGVTSKDWLPNVKTQTGIDDPNQAQTFVSKPEQPDIGDLNTPIDRDKALSGGFSKDMADNFPNMNMELPSPFKKNTSTPEKLNAINALVTSLGVSGTDGIPSTNAPMGGLAALATQASTPMTGVSTTGIPKTITQEFDFNNGYQNPGTRAQTQEDIDQDKMYEDLRNGKTPAQTPNAPIYEYNPNDYFYNSGGAKQGGLIKRHAEGGLTNLDHGGFVIPADVVSHFGNGSSSAGLELLAQKMGATPIKGDGDGMSDSIPAAIDGREKALVANDEAYLSPQMVERLGDGDMDAGSRKLKNIMEQIRKARTGNPEQGKQINPNNFMPGGTVGYAQGGGIKSYAGTDPTGSLVQAGVTGTEQNLSNYAGPAITNMLGKAQALSNTPYQAYTGPLTAGASGLQNLAFQNAGNLAPNGGMTTDFAQQAGNMNYTPTTSSFNEGFAQQYMNPYLQASLNPQLDEARRQSEITQQQNNAAMTKAGAFGGGRQAILTSENQRNLGTNQANITGAGYNTAYDKAMAQFNADQNRQMQENQFANTSKISGLNTGISGLSTANQMGINNLKTQADLGLTQRGIESEGIAADKAQFEEARKDPYSKLQYLQSMFNGLPITAQNYTMSQPNAFQGAAGGAKTLAELLKALGIGT
jgi:hypothetical protein